MAKIEHGTIFDVKNEDLKKMTKNFKKFWKEVKFLGERAFEKCSDLVEISIPNNVVMAYENPFEGCEKLEKFNIENSCDPAVLLCRSAESSPGKCFRL